MSIFGTNYADGYDALYQEKDYRCECDLIERCFNLQKSTDKLRILDVGCGTGGHALELARRGHSLAGVDLSSNMVQVANQKANALEKNLSHPKFFVGDARHFDLSKEEPYDAAVMMFAVIGYLTSNEDIVAALSNIRKHLRPDARFVCDFWWGPAVLTERPGERVRIVPTPTGKLLRATQTRLDTTINVAEVHFELFTLEAMSPAKEFRETHRMRYFFGPELHLLFGLSGFKVLKIGQFPDVDAAPTDTSWNSTAIAQAI